MSCVLRSVRENNDLVFEAPGETEVRLIARGGTADAAAAIVAAAYDGKDIPITDGGLRFSTLPGLKTLRVFVDSDPVRSVVEICEVCSADPLRVNVLDRFVTSEPPEPRALDLRGAPNAGGQ